MVSSAIIVINILLIVLFSFYRIYLHQTSQIQIDQNRATQVAFFEKYLDSFTSLLGINHTNDYINLPIISLENESHIGQIINTSYLTFAQKKEILREKIHPLIATITNQAQEIEQVKKDIAKF